MGPYNRDKGEICAEEREGVPIVEGRKGGSEGVYQEAVKERIYMAVEVTTNGASILCGKEE